MKKVFILLAAIIFSSFQTNIYATDIILRVEVQVLTAIEKFTPYKTEHNQESSIQDIIQEAIEHITPTLECNTVTIRYALASGEIEKIPVDKSDFHKTICDLNPFTKNDPIATVIMILG